MYDFDIAKANLFWASARSRVLRLAESANLSITLEDHDDPFLYDLFDCGDYEPTDDEIIEAIREDLC